jgi:hypothetical protein
MSSDPAPKHCPGASGLLSELPGRWPEFITLMQLLLKGCPKACDFACYACLKALRNQFHHSLLTDFEPWNCLNPGAIPRSSIGQLKLVLKNHDPAQERLRIHGKLYCSASFRTTISRGVIVANG